ncbi:unnamed protein product [Rodentolepis nana]|uniref:C2 domain-containing protein n=1 Tax=Rodentolepis nana TaxID=102285 RepID=A0A0R3T0Z1_RODNA|nr:unnamed protein product [Rodentolepis nana]
MGQSVIVEVLDKDNSTKDDELGLTTIPIEDVYLSGSIDSVQMLEGVKKGKVHLKITWLDLSPNPGDFVDVDRLRRSSGSDRAIYNSYLFVRIEEAKNLILRDSKTEFVLGTLSIPLKYLKAEKNMTITQPYALQAAGPDNATLYLHLELRALVPGPDRRPPIESSLPGSPTSDEDMNIADATKIDADSTSNDPTEPPKPGSPEAENVVRHRHHGFKGNDGNMQTMVAPPDPAGRIRLTIRYDVNLEILTVTIESAEELLGVDKDGLSDPYVKLSLIDGCGHTVGDSKKTKPVKNDLNPQFNESFEFSVNSEVLGTCKLCVNVKNHVGVLQRGSHTRELGFVVLTLKSLKDGVGFTEWQLPQDMQIEVAAE